MVSTNEPANVNEKRIKKSIERLSELYEHTTDINKERKSIIQCGSGVSLGDIERVKDVFHRAKIDKQMSRNIHLLCYKTIGLAMKRNNEIKKFNGFNKDDGNETTKRLIIAARIKISSLKLICDLFNVPVTGKQKKEIVEDLVEFLKCPSETGSMLFRTSALRPRGKRRQKKNVNGAIGKKQGPNEDNLSECDSEQVVVIKTKRLTVMEGSTNESVEKHAETEDKEGMLTKDIHLSKSKTLDKGSADVEIEEAQNKSDVKKDHNKYKGDTFDKDKENKNVNIGNKDSQANRISDAKNVNLVDAQAEENRSTNNKCDASKENKSDSNQSLNTSNKRMKTMELQIDKIALNILKRKKTIELSDPRKVHILKSRFSKISKFCTDMSSSKSKSSSKTAESKSVVSNESSTIKSPKSRNESVIKDKIIKVLQDVDLSKTTLNQVCDKIMLQFPDIDPVTERHWMKQLVRKVIEEH